MIIITLIYYITKQRVCETISIIKILTINKNLVWPRDLESFKDEYRSQAGNVTLYTMSDSWITYNIPCVPHKNNCKTKIGSHDMKQIDSSIIIVRNVCLNQHPWLFIFSSRGCDRQSSGQNNRKLISFHNNGEDNKHAHGFADF